MRGEHGTAAHRAIPQQTRTEGTEMAIQLCYICAHNHPKDVREQAPSYTNCERCKQPTCKKHGRAIGSDRFYCIRCVKAMAR